MASMQDKTKLVVRDVKDAVTELCSKMDETVRDMDEKARWVLDHMTDKLSHIDDVTQAHRLIESLTQSLLSEGSEIDVINGPKTLPAIESIQVDPVTVRIPQFSDILSEFLSQVKMINKTRFFTNVPQTFCVAGHSKDWTLKYVNEVVKGEHKVTGIKFNSGQHELIARTSDPDSSLHCFKFSAKAQAFTLLKHFAISEIHNWKRPISLDTKRSLILAPSGRNGLYRIETNGSISDRINSSNLDLSAVAYDVVADLYVLSDEKTGRLVLVHPITRHVIRTLGNYNGERSTSLNTNLAVLSHPYRLAVTQSSHNKIYIYNDTYDIERTYGPDIEGYDKLCHPMGVCYHVSGAIVVCDSGNSRVLRLWADTAGDHCQCLLDREQLGGEPTMVDIDSEHRYLAVLVGSNTVKLYTF